MKKVVLYHLIGGQPLPNLIAARQLGAYRHVLFYTKDSEANMKSFVRVLAGAKCTPVLVEPFDFAALRKSIQRAIMVEAESEHILNFTGGTKVMALAADQIFRERGLKRVYVNSERSEIIEFSSTGVAQQPFAVKLTIDDYLRINNLSRKKNTRAPSDEEMRERLRYARFLAQPTVLKRTRHARESLSKLINNGDQWTAFLRKNNGVLRPKGKDTNFMVSYEQRTQTADITISGTKFSICGSDAMEYVVGGFWFEDLFRVEKIEGQSFFDDVRFNVKVPAVNSAAVEDGDDYIEFDMLATRGERLYVFELKSGQLRQEAINKATKIRELLGNYVKMYIVHLGLSKDKIAVALQRQLNDLNIIAVHYDKFSLDNATFRRNVNL